MQELISAPPHETNIFLESLYKHIRAVIPMTQKQYRMLPKAIEGLSTILTEERGDMAYYWSSAPMLSAYFYYYLPWNLVRLANILPNLAIPTVEEFASSPVLLDMGSGSLTLPIALWMFRKELREVPLTIYCVDTSRKPMDYGRQLLEHIMQKKQWKIVLLDGRKQNVLHELHGKSTLSIAGNVCNELVQKSQDRLEDVVAKFCTRMTKTLTPKGQFLCIEIGNRLGGKIIGSMQQHVVEQDAYQILAPCTHRSVCPYVGERSTAWCHFRFANFTAPTWLCALTEKAKLSKTTLSISLLQIGKDAIVQGNSRVLSGLIRLPETRKQVRYICRKEGIGVVEGAEHFVQGSVITTQDIIPQRIDAKSKAPFVQIV